MPSPKGSNLSRFGNPKPQEASSVEDALTPPAAPKGDTRIGRTVRFTPAQWRTVRNLETDLNRTFQDLCIAGISLILEQQGLGPL
jgi:hypothetical protein